MQSKIIGILAQEDANGEFYNTFDSLPSPSSSVETLTTELLLAVICLTAFGCIVLWALVSSRQRGKKRKTDIEKRADE